ncbi:MAG: hypothetical protein ABSE66_09920 [Thermoplasmata archaeon]
MTQTLRLADLSRRELENLILTEHGALKRVLEAVREHTEPGWTVRRKVEEIIEEARDRRPFKIAIERAEATDRSKEAADRNGERWSRWGA